MPTFPIRFVGARPRSRVVIALAALALSSACLSSLPAAPPIEPQPRFDPIRFFSGHTHGEGTLDVRAGSDRKLTVEGMGTANPDGTFTLGQTITFDDGAVEQRKWVLRRSDSTHYAATLSDAKGEVTAETNGTQFHLRYLIRSPEVFMEQWLYLQPDGRTVLNQAEVTVLGVPWAHLSETITRVP